MRLQTISLLLLTMLCSSLCKAQMQTDVALTAAVTAQTAALNDVYNKRNKMQKAILTAQSAATVTLEQIHQIEKKTLNYLMEAQSIMTNLHQVKRCAELMGVEIPKNISFLRESVSGNFKGTAIASLVTTRITSTYTEAASLYTYIEQLVTSSSSGKKKHKVNLLNSAERYKIANDILTKLEKINTNLWLLSWQIRTFSWYDLWRGLDYESWARIVQSKAIADAIIQDWKRMRNKY